jgi:hypothetical protein
VHPCHLRFYRLQDKDFGCVMGRRRVTTQPSPSILAKIFILKPIVAFNRRFPAARSTHRQGHVSRLQSFRFTWLSKEADEHGASGDHNRPGQPPQVDGLDRIAEQAEVIQQKRCQHLTGDDERQHRGGSQLGG